MDLICRQCFCCSSNQAESDPDDIICQFHCRYSRGVDSIIHLGEKDFQKHSLMAFVLGVSSTKTSVFSDSSFFIVNVSWLLYCSITVN